MLTTRTHLSDVLTDVLDDHLVSGDGLHGEQSPLVDPAAPKTKLLFAELKKEGKEE